MDATTLNVILAACLLLLGGGIQFFVSRYRGKLSLDDQRRLELLSNRAVGAAEELGKREDWTGPQKLKYVKEMILEQFPKLDGAILELAIHGALAVLKLGDIGASSTEKESALPTSKR